MILAGDVGGTKTNVGLFSEGGGARPEVVRKATFRSHEYDGLIPILREFLAGESASISAAGFGIAGPVIEQKVKTPNLPWTVEAARIEAELGIPRAILLNDLEATADGIPVLTDDEVVTLCEGETAEEGNVALSAAGTGLGMCIVSRHDGWHPMATEGGHQTFAPRNDDEIGIARFLAKRYGHVSVERVVSGPGVMAVYEYLLSRGEEPNPAVKAEISGQEDYAHVVTRAGMEESCSVCVKALDLFLSAYGSASGNLALVSLARGGLYLGGGIAPKLMPKLADGTFERGFTEKGRFRGLLERIPVKLLTNPETALLGAATRAEKGAVR